MSNRKISALTMGINGLFMVALFGFVGFRLMSGSSVLPVGYQPWVIGLVAFVPISCAALGNYLRLRRDA
jgi:hypothetical protein